MTRTSPLRQQVQAQKVHARILSDFLGLTVPLELWVVWYPEAGYGRKNAGVSIVGHTIVRSAPEIWRARGARVRKIGVVAPRV